MKRSAIELADIPELVEMARAGHGESKYRQFPFSEEAMRSTFIEHLPQLAIKVTAHNELAGFLLASKTGMVFTYQPIVMETCYYIRPKYRGSRGFFMLMTAFIQWEPELPHFCLPHFAEDNTKTYTALEKLGFTDMGRLYARGV